VHDYLQNGNFVYCIDSYRMLFENILTQNYASGFVFFLRMFQDKCNRDCNRDYLQCNRNRNRLYLCCNCPMSD